MGSTRRALRTYAQRCGAALGMRRRDGVFRVTSQRALRDSAALGWRHACAGAISSPISLETQAGAGDDQSDTAGGRRRLVGRRRAGHRDRRHPGRRDVFVRFRPRAGSIGMRLVLFLSIGSALLLVLTALQRVDSIGPVRFWAGTALNALSHVVFWGAVNAHGGRRPSGAFASGPPDSLALTGPYRLVRHPIYVAYLLALCAAASLCGSAEVWLVTAWMAVVYALAAVQEERLILESSLAESYRRYRQRVGMFVPKVSWPTRRDGHPMPSGRRDGAPTPSCGAAATRDDPRHVFAKAHLPLQSPAEYRKALRPLLPRSAFLPSPAAARTLFTGLFLSYLAYVPLAFLESPWWALVFGPVAGVLLSSALFAGHEVSHGTAIRNRRLRYCAEVLAFSPFLLSATAWRRFHNQIHHRHASTFDDSDRLPARSERSRTVDRLLRLTVPHEGGHVWNPLMGAHSLLYSLLITLWTAAPGRSANAPNLALVRQRGTRALLVFELGAMLVSQWAVFRLSGSIASTFFLASGLSIFTASSIANFYIYTNHMLNPLSPSVDPVIGTTSVSVPRVLDWLHSHFSHHTEHHLFPGMASEHYPLVRKALVAVCPERFNCLPIADVYRLMMRTGPYAVVRDVASSEQS